MPALPHVASFFCGAAGGLLQMPVRGIGARIRGSVCGWLISGDSWTRARETRPPYEHTAGTFIFRFLVLLPLEKAWATPSNTHDALAPRSRPQITGEKKTSYSNEFSLLARSPLDVACAGPCLTLKACKY
jgi:hypothetical protein